MKCLEKSKVFKDEVLQQRYETFIHLFSNGLSYPSTLYYTMKSDAFELVVAITKLELSKRTEEDEQIKNVLIPVITWIENHKRIDRNRKLKLMNELVRDIESKYLLISVLSCVSDSMELVFDKIVFDEEDKLTQFAGGLILDALVSLSINVITSILHESRIMTCFKILSSKVKLPFGKEKAFISTMNSIYALNDELAMSYLVKEVENNETIYYPYDKEIRKLMNKPEEFRIRLEEEI